MTSQAVEGTWQRRSQGSLLLRGKRENPGNELGMWIRTGGYRRFTGEWVKKENRKKLTNQCLLALRKYLQCRLCLLQQENLTLHNKVVTYFSGPYF